MIKLGQEGAQEPGRFRARSRCARDDLADTVQAAHAALALRRQYDAAAQPNAFADDANGYSGALRFLMRLAGAS